MSVSGRRPEVIGRGQNEAIDRAPRGREPSVREGLTRTIVDWSGSWQAARLGNWLGRSPATKAALGRNQVKPEQASKVLMRMPLGKAARVGKHRHAHPRDPPG
jgi:hypothetical protein